MADETPIETTVTELKKLIDVGNCIGEAIETEDKILIPVSKVGFGFGAGTQDGTKNANGGAGAAGIEPVSMIVITKGVSGIEGIRVLSLSKASELNKTINDLGLIIGDMIKERFPAKKEDETSEENVDSEKVIIDVE